MKGLFPRLVLVTGSAGFLGRAIVDALASDGFAVRGLDVAKPPESSAAASDRTAGAVSHVVGDVSDSAAIAQACEGCEAMVIAHMAPNRPGVYDSATLPFDINVKGTALLFEEAVRRGITRVVLISSISVVDGHRSSAERLTLSLPPRPVSLYGLTKVCQEEIAAFHHRASKISVAILRPAYVTDADNLTDKYGRKRPSVNWQTVDRRDVAGAAIAALRAPSLGFGIYYVHGHPDAVRKLEIEPTVRDLGWTPTHDFSAYPTDGG